MWKSLEWPFLGLDHWYTARLWPRRPPRVSSTRLVAVAHDDTAKGSAAAFRCRCGALDDRLPRGARPPDVDIVVVLYSTDRNVAICQEAAALGKHIVSVKPMALDLAGADAIVAGGARSRRAFLLVRKPAPHQPRGAAAQALARRGPDRPAAALHPDAARQPADRLARQLGDRRWWTDPARVPGGAWIDHAIYAVDMLRWLLGSEPTKSAASAGNQRYAELAVEDFGVATYTHRDGAVALIEDTWTADRGYGFSRTELFGSAGTITEDSNLRGAVALRGDFGLEGR